MKIKELRLKLWFFVNGLAWMALAWVLLCCWSIVSQGGT